MRWTEVGGSGERLVVDTRQTSRGRPTASGATDEAGRRHTGASRPACRRWRNLRFENRRGAGSIAHRCKKAASILCRGLSFEFCAHDVRRTAATRMAEAGVPRDHIAKILNHFEGAPAATRVYDRYAYDAEKRSAVDRWVRRLADIVDCKCPKVTPIRQRATAAEALRCQSACASCPGVRRRETGSLQTNHVAKATARRRRY
jgi:integrase